MAFDPNNFLNSMRKSLGLDFKFADESKALKIEPIKPLQQRGGFTFIDSTETKTSTVAFVKPKPSIDINLERALEERADEGDRFARISLEQLRAPQPSIIERTKVELGDILLGGFQPTGVKTFEELSAGEQIKAVGLESGKNIFRGLSDVGSGVFGTVSGLLGSLEWAGVKEAKPFADKLDEWIETIRPENEVFADKLASGIGSLATFFVPGLGSMKLTSMIARFSPRVAAWVGAGVMTFLESATEAGEVYRTNIKQGEIEQKASKEASNDFFINLVLLGITNKLGFFGESANKLTKTWKGILLRSGVSGVMEGIQEWGQGVAGNVTTDRPWDENIWDSALVGFITGALFGGGEAVEKNFPNSMQIQLDLRETYEKLRDDQRGFIKVPGLGGEEKIPIGKEEEEKPKKEVKKEIEVVKPLTQQFESLVEEAKKFKTAEEFVKAQQPFFRATDKKFDVKLLTDDGLFVSPKRSIAEGYLEKGKIIDELFIKPDAKILTFENTPKELYKIDEGFAIPRDNGDGIEIAKYAKSKGFDVVEYGVDPQKLAPESAIVSKDVIITKSQLINIYNQATKKAEPIAEAPREPVRLPPSRPPTQRTRRILGIPEVKKITKREDVLLRKQVRDQAKGSRFGYRAGVRETRESILTSLREERQEIKEVKKQIIEYIKQSLPVKDRGKFLTMVANAKNQRSLIKAFARIDIVAEVSVKKRLNQEIIKIFKRAMKSMNVAVDYKTKIRLALNEYENKGHTKRLIQRLEATRKYIDGRLEAGEDVEIPQRVLRALQILGRKPLKEMTVPELEGILNEISLLEHLGKTKWKSRRELYKAEQGAIKDSVIKNIVPIETLKKFEPLPAERLTKSEKIKNFVINSVNIYRGVGRALMPMDVVFDIFDGSRGTYDGVVTRLIKKPIDANFNSFMDSKDSMQNPIIELAVKLRLEQSNYERIATIAVSEQKNGFGKLERIGITEKDVAKIKLTKEEQELLDKMREVMDKSFPKIQDLMKELYNVDVNKVEDYFPFMTDWKAMEEIRVNERMVFPTKKVEMGFTKSRTGIGDQRLNLNAMTVFLKHSENVAYLLETGRTTKMLFEIINSKEFRDAAGNAGQAMALDWIDTIARKGGVAGNMQIGWLDSLRRNLSAGVLGYKLSSIAIQWTALIDGMGIIGPQWGLKGTQSFLTSKEWRKFILQFPELRERMGGETAIKEIINNGVEKSFLERLQVKGFVPLQFIDSITASSVAVGAYQQKMSEMGKAIELDKKPNKEALEYTQLVVRRTQATALFKDVPLAISKGTAIGNRSIARLILQFQNFLLFRWSRIRHDAIRVGITTKNPKKAANVLAWIIISSFAAVLTRVGVNKLIDFLTGSDDDRDEDIIQKLMSELAGTVPFVGNLIGIWIYGSAAIPVEQMTLEAISGLSSAMNGKKPDTRKKGWIKFIGSMLALGGVPGAFQAKQVLRKTVEEKKGGYKSF